MRPELLQKLQNIVDNPNFYRGLTPEEQAELFLFLFTPKKKLFQKPKVIQGINGKTPEKDVDYLSLDGAERMIKELSYNTTQQLESIIKAKLDSIKVTNGKDAVITEELIVRIAEMAQAMIILPDFPTLLTMEPEAVRDSLELLQDDDRLDKSAIKGLDDYEEVARLAKEPKVIHGGGVSQNWVTSNTIGNTFETVSKNLKAYSSTLNYTGDNLTSITYTNGIIKTLAYTGDNLTSVVLSGSTPAGIDLTKTLSYTGANLTGVVYT